MPDIPAIDRRRAMAALGVGLGVVAFGRPSWAALLPTPAQTMGPFYPPVLPLDRDNDLMQVEGRSGRAQGEMVQVLGRVLDASGRAIPGAHVEIWQANAAGRYIHPGDRSDAPLDPNFQGFGVSRSDAAGAYRFRTIRPGAYANRTRHIHFQVKAAGSTLVTQMYFPGEPLNARDFLLRSARQPEALIARPASDVPGLEAGAPALIFDIVLG